MRILNMIAGYNFSPRRRFAVLTGLVAASWSMVVLATDVLLR
ncbi:hypothetical protein [Sphingomonas phyllosphaerae]|jgi:hypothetical protein|nr:hypothetical protein [Sphingomonas phyllosphaerae]